MVSGRCWLHRMNSEVFLPLQLKIHLCESPCVLIGVSRVWEPSLVLANPPTPTMRLRRWRASHGGWIWGRGFVLTFEFVVPLSLPRNCRWRSEAGRPCLGWVWLPGEGETPREGAWGDMHVLNLLGGWGKRTARSRGSSCGPRWPV